MDNDEPDWLLGQKDWTLGHFGSELEDLGRPLGLVGSDMEKSERLLDDSGRGIENPGSEIGGFEGSLEKSGSDNVASEGENEGRGAPRLRDRRQAIPNSLAADPSFSMRSSYLSQGGELLPARRSRYDVALRKSLVKSSARRSAASVLVFM